MGRQPSRELFRFLTTYWPFSASSLPQVREEAAGFPPEKWADFDQAAINRDFEEAIPEKGGIAIRDVAKPLVLCVFGDGGDGKSTLASLLKRSGAPVFSTDRLVCSLRDGWHNDDDLRNLATEHGPTHIDAFIRDLERSGPRQQRFVELFFHAEHGFNYREPLSIIEGFIHSPDVQPHDHCPQALVVKMLRQRGYRVWIASRCKG